MNDAGPCSCCPRSQTVMGRSGPGESGGGRHDRPGPCAIAKKKMLHTSEAWSGVAGLSRTAGRAGGGAVKRRRSPSVAVWVTDRLWRRRGGGPKRSSASSRGLGAGAPGGQRHQEVLGERGHVRLVHPPQLGQLVLGVPCGQDDARGRQARAKTSELGRCQPIRRRADGGAASTWARSTTAWRAIAKVRPAWREHAPSDATITSTLASSTVVSAASHDWLSCCER